MTTRASDILERIFRKAVRVADPGRGVAVTLRAGPEGLSLLRGGNAAAATWAGAGNVYLVGGGKAGRAMGEAALAVLGGRIAAGTIAVPHGDGRKTGTVRFLEAGHPAPDPGSLAAARDILSLLSRAGEGDLVIALISGGGSAMLCAPADGVSLEEKAALSGLLVRAGADIHSLNAVRKHLSLIKGGRAAIAASPAGVWALLLSDVPGDDPSVIASGPFSPDPTTFGDAMAVLSRFGVLREAPRGALRRLEAGASGKSDETPKPGHSAFAAVTCVVIGSNRTALEGAAEAAKAEGIGSIRLLPGFLSGEAGECAKSFVAEMRLLSSSLPPGETAALIAGGETTVRVEGRGTGGRCQEFALSAAIELSGTAGMTLLCAGTDGIDGPTDAAGAIADGSTCDRAKVGGLSPDSFLENNDAYALFRVLGDLVVTGPTGTNVADVAIGLVSKT
ncbi:MAG: glycerate kinase [Deltaproteobacteria bacterium]|nr:MAG: glycerate kinase [Deltaproteobacteria bacterium]